MLTYSPIATLGYGNSYVSFHQSFAFSRNGDITRTVIMEGEAVRNTSYNDYELFTDLDLARTVKLQYTI